MLNNNIPLRLGIPSVHSRIHWKIREILNLPIYIPQYQLVYHADDLELYFLRPWDIPIMVDRGYIDIAFCGTDIVNEYSYDINICQTFTQFQAKFGLCIKANQSEIIAPIKVATEYPKLANNFLKTRFSSYEIIQVRGSTEAYAHFRGISAIIDIIETGRTMMANNLKLIEIVDYTYPCLIMKQEADISDRYKNVSFLSTTINSILSNSRQVNSDV